MSQEHVEVVRRLSDAWNRGDRDAWMALQDPAVAFQTSGYFPDLEPSYHGHSGIDKFWRSMRDPWNEVRLDIERLAEGGDRVAVACRYRAIGATSGVEVDRVLAFTFTIRDGRIVSSAAFISFEDALESAGLSE